VKRVSANREYIDLDVLKSIQSANTDSSLVL